MANKPIRDWFYLTMIGLQLTGLFGTPPPPSPPLLPPFSPPSPPFRVTDNSSSVIDLIPFYPRPLWEPAGAPLHFLVGLRRGYLAWTGDPLSASVDVHGGAAWFKAFLVIAGLVQSPIAAFLMSRLAAPQRMGGAAELAGLLYGCMTFMGSAVCCYELLRMGPDQLAPEKKPRLLYGMYLPFFVMTAVLAVDMVLRLLPRVQNTGAKDKNE
ncbi:hypothetical protein MY11210_003026 [Beauveria gryllotalpidicola]